MILKNEYDLIFSLGGSCAVAKQLIFNNLRKCSLPFDWLFHFDNDSIEYLIYAFEFGFGDWMKFENLVELAPSERGDSELYQYKDILTGFNTIHDFEKPTTDHNAMIEVTSKYTRRINRMLDYLSRANSVLLILDARYTVDQDLLVVLKMVIQKKYPALNIDLVLLQFNANTDCDSTYANIQIRYIMRNHTAEEYNGRPKEWDFLENISLSEVIFHD